MTDGTLSGLVETAATKIVLLVMDGLGGLPRRPGGSTELESARTPNLDALAAQSDLGLTVPVAPGISPGSGPGHLALFGYDPLAFPIGRGAMEALGADFELGPEDLAARGNFCSVDVNGVLTDRRAGRIPTELNRELCGLLESIRLDEAQVFLRPVRDHRFALVLRGPALGDALSESDPQRSGVPVPGVRALAPGSERSAALIGRFVDQARVLLSERQPANMILLRGFSASPALPGFWDRYRLRAAAIAARGMYRGVARLAGMQVLDLAGESLDDECAALEAHWGEFDFFYLHVKQIDTAGELGDFDGKVRAIEDVDALVPRILALGPEVLIVGGDHSSPAVLRAHSWHPVPLLMHSRSPRTMGVADFGERACARGSLGMIRAVDVMPLALAHAGRLGKYGA